MNRFIFDLQRFNSAFSGGDGSQNNPYQIATVADLQQLAIDVNAGNNYTSKFFILTADLDLATLKDDTGNQLNWTPIGNDGNRFKGTFDGGIYDEQSNLTGNHTISNLKITGGNYCGLFGYVDGGTIKNVTLTNADISGNKRVGGIAGYNNSTIENCTVSGTISGSNNEVGGIAGYNNSTIENCTVSGTISGDSWVGGIAGYNSSRTIDNCTVSGNISGSYHVGGIAGYNFNSTIQDCTVNSSISGKNLVGGIVGKHYSGTVQNNFADTTISGNKLVGSIAGHRKDDTYSGNEYASNVNDNTGATKWYSLDLPEGITAAHVEGTGTTKTVGDKTYYSAGATVQLTIDSTLAAKFSDLGLQTNDTSLNKTDSGYQCTFSDSNVKIQYNKDFIVGLLDCYDEATNIHTISTKEQLKTLADYVAAGNSCKGYKFKLGDSISGVDFHIGTAKAKFAGTFDGNGYKITVNYGKEDNRISTLRPVQLRGRRDNLKAHCRRQHLHCQQICGRFNRAELWHNEYHRLPLKRHH